MLPGPVFPSLLQDADELAGCGVGLQLCHSAADPVPADPEEGAQGLLALLSFWLPGDHAKGVGPGQSGHPGEGANGWGNGETFF